MPPKIKGLHDIRTHGSLDHEGRLPGVAKNLGKINIGIGGLTNSGGHRKSSGNPEQSSWDGNVKCLKKGPKKELPAPTAKQNKYNLLKDLDEQIAEMEEFVKEGFSGTKEELERLKQRRSRIEKMK